ncbi:hypothetical protein [Streptomyces sp. NBC_00079]|uniref:hypothetical protein n=1 Tax=Streptomyces sp. NBC_00079 TaxID=2975644 RepID=UPI00324D4427
MIDHTLAQPPETPAEVAAAILDAIDAQPGALDMWLWTSLAPCQSLAPDQLVGDITLCVAGWACRVSGWTLVCSDIGMDYAHKGGPRYNIADVAANALGLSHEEAEDLFSQSEDIARQQLAIIAGH